MNPNVVAIGAGFAFLVFLALANLIETRRLRRIVADALAANVAVVEPLTVEHAPAVERAPAEQAASAPTAASAQLPRAAEPGAFDDEDEATRVVSNPLGAEGAPGSCQGTDRLRSTPATAQPARPVDAVAARFAGAGGARGGEDDGPTLKQSDDGPANAPVARRDAKGRA